MKRIIADETGECSAEHVVKVTPEALSREAFRPYGSILAMGRPIFPQLEGGKPVIFMTKLKRKPGRQLVTQMATHFTYNQNFTVFQGALAMVVAPAPQDRDGPLEQQHFDYKRVKAFILEPGTCVDIAHGTWHNLMPLSEEVLLMTGTRYDADKESFKGSQEVKGGEIPVAANADAAKQQHAIDHIDLVERDDHCLELVA
jgi:ureidoglycolate hydrolase